MEDIAPGRNTTKFMNILLIDTTSNKGIKVGLKINKQTIWLHSKIRVRSSQVVLPLIDKILKKHKLTVRDINNIEVNAGPGSFTGIRVGVSIANALSYALKIPVNK